MTFPFAPVIWWRTDNIVDYVSPPSVGPIYAAFIATMSSFHVRPCGGFDAAHSVASNVSSAVDFGRIPSRLIRGIAGVCLAAGYFAGIDGHEVFGFSWIAFCSALLLVNADEAQDGKLRPPPTRTVCWFGKHSYELYLFHIIVLAGMRDLVPKGTLPYAYKLPYFALYLLLSALMAGAVSRYLAEPTNAGLRRVLAGGSSARRRG